MNTNALNNNINLAISTLPSQTFDDYELTEEVMDSSAWMIYIAENFFIILVTVFLNLAMIFVIFRNNKIQRRRRITPVQGLMLHMAAADLLFAFITLLPNAVLTLIEATPGPAIVCQLIKYASLIPMYASSFLMVAISADRYQVICKPFVNLRRGAYRRPNIYATIAWIFSLICAIPNFIIWESNEFGECSVVGNRQWEQKLNVLFFNIIAWLLPSFIAGLFYYNVCDAVYSSSLLNSGKASSHSMRSSLSSHADCAKKGEAKKYSLISNFLSTSRRASALSTSGDGAKSQCENRMQTVKLQTVKLTMTIVLVNFILWTPFNFVNILDMLNIQIGNGTLLTCIVMFGNINSLSNPLIYFFFNKSHVKKAFGLGQSNEFTTDNSTCNNNANKKDVSRRFPVSASLRPLECTPSESQTFKKDLGCVSFTQHNPKNVRI
uniref:G_PROTEIN_RECEP_F1_2 domain-containing protein n=1 Tax=Rhabditophanes sp. KR3021 TaxID=114890 RepID=A0AC35TQS1_9BILA